MLLPTELKGANHRLQTNNTLPASPVLFLCEAKGLHRWEWEEIILIQPQRKLSITCSRGDRHKTLTITPHFPGNKRYRRRRKDSKEIISTCGDDSMVNGHSPNHHDDILLKLLGSGFKATYLQGTGKDCG